MTQTPTVSVIIVSRDRPDHLRRCLLGVSQLRYPQFEVVVVTDAAGQAALRPMPQAAHIRMLRFDVANISEARNLGVAHAAGEVIAFIDDDAVPEPTWLTHLAAPFTEPDVQAAGGFVRGRNGISFQWKAEAVDKTGLQTPIQLATDRPHLLRPARDQAIRTQGTNMAVRRDILAEIGGFDPRFRFFLDETDLNMRLAAMGGRTAIVPMAEVHHGFAPSPRRRPDRVPKDLTEIGASWAVFLTKHCPEPKRQQAWTRVLATEKQRLLRHLVSGALEPRDIGRLMRGLETGYAEGIERAHPAMPRLLNAAEAFLRFPSNPFSQSVVHAGYHWARRKLESLAQVDVAAGRIVTVMLLSPTALYHHIQFTNDGFWVQKGGVSGKSERDERLVRLCTFEKRVVKERKRLAGLRDFEQKYTS